MIEEGALEGVDAIFGLHLWQDLATGIVGVVKGPMMAQPDAFSITIKGKGGHGSMPQQTVVVSFGTIIGGTIYNIIPEKVTLTGTVRSFDADVQKLTEQRLREITQKTCETYGATAEFKYDIGYASLVNDAGMVDFIEKITAKTLGKERIKHIDPVMGGEDFAYYLKKVPGAFLFFGMGDGTQYPHHHPGFDIDEKALPYSTLGPIYFRKIYFSFCSII